MYCSTVLYDFGIYLMIISVPPCILSALCQFALPRMYGTDALSCRNHGPPLYLNGAGSRGSSITQIRRSPSRDQMNANGALLKVGCCSCVLAAIVLPHRGNPPLDCATIRQSICDHWDPHELRVVGTCQAVYQQ